MEFTTVCISGFLHKYSHLHHWPVALFGGWPTSSFSLTMGMVCVCPVRDSRLPRIGSGYPTTLTGIKIWSVTVGKSGGRLCVPSTSWFYLNNSFDFHHIIVQDLISAKANVLKLCSRALSLDLTPGLHGILLTRAAIHVIVQWLCCHTHTHFSLTHCELTSVLDL